MGYTDEKVDEALGRLASRFTKVIKKLNDEDLAILAYVMSPDDTTPFWGRRQIEESLWEVANKNMCDQFEDENGRYMLVRIGEKIYRGEL